MIYHFALHTIGETDSDWVVAYKSVYWSSPPFLEERLLRDLLRLPADFLPAFLLPLRLRLPDFLLGAAFLREPRLFGAILMNEL